MVEAFPDSLPQPPAHASTTALAAVTSSVEVKSMTKTQQRTAAVIAYEGALGTMPWSSRQWIAEAFANDFQRHSSSFDRSTFIEACKRESEKDD